MNCGTSEPGSSGIEQKLMGPVGTQLFCQVLSLFSILNGRMKGVLIFKTIFLMYISCC